MDVWMDLFGTFSGVRSYSKMYGVLCGFRVTIKQTPIKRSKLRITAEHVEAYI